MKRYSICITGKLTQTRGHYIQRIENAGHYWHPRVTGDTDLLVMADPNTGSSKARKAAENGTRCIDEVSLNNLLNDTEGKGFFNAFGKYVVGFSRKTVTSWVPDEPEAPEEPQKPQAETSSRLLPD